MLRGLLLLLLLANALFLAWTRGWLGDAPRQGQREPERIAAQVNPQAVRLLPPKAANAALQAARADALRCLEAGPFGDKDIVAAEAAVAQAELAPGSWVRVDTGVAPVWLVYAGRYPDAPLRKVREEDLRKQGLGFELLQSPSELAPGLVLSRHASREQAQSWLNAKSTPALRGVRVVQLPPTPQLFRLRVARADQAVADSLKALGTGAALGGGFKPCAAAP